MSLTPEQIAAIEGRITVLKTARDSGVLSVRHGETFTQFRSLDEITMIISELEGDLSTNAGTRTRVRYSMQRTKGY